jgi:hypothetical protein
MYGDEPMKKVSTVIKNSDIIHLGAVVVWSYGSWIYNYLFNPCLSPLKLWVRTPFMGMCIRENINMLEDSINRMYGDEPMKKVSTVIKN